MKLFFYIIHFGFIFSYDVAYALFIFPLIRLSEGLGGQ